MLINSAFSWDRLTLRRVTVAAIGCLTLLTVSIMLERAQPAVYRIAEGMLGENWYRIELSADHVGFMYNNAFVDQRGKWHFQSTTHFRLQDDAPNTLTKHLIFGSRAPFPLLEATYTHHDAGQQVTTRVTRQVEGYTAQLERSGQATVTPRPVPLDWQYDLGRFLSFEKWLSTTRPEAGQQHVTASLDFERLRIDSRAYRVVEQNSAGYLVETAAPFAATRTQLDSQFKPSRLTMAGIFDVIASSEAEAISLTSLQRKTRYLFDVDQRLDDHTSIAALHLRVDTDATHPQLPSELKLSHNPVTSQGEGLEHIGEELRYPITHPTIQSMAQQSMAGAPSATIEQLVDSTHQRLRYVEDKPAGSVLTALDRGEGECTDYADLFTTLARAAGFPARNVYGLAYKDGPRPAFMFHAWNEVFAGGRWQSVDPTWNQTRVDASHIPLSDSQAALMMLANNTSGVSFSVLGVEYF